MSQLHVASKTLWDPVPTRNGSIYLQKTLKVAGPMAPRGAQMLGLLPDVKLSDITPVPHPDGTPPTSTLGNQAPGPGAARAAPPV